MNLEPEKEHTVICVKCWCHINDFHEFQKSVLLAQTKLVEDVKPVEAIIKEEDDIPIPTFNFNTEACKDGETISTGVGVFEDGNHHIEEDEKIEFSLPDLELFDSHHENPFSSDDEKPLLECFPKTKVNRKTTRRKNTKISDNTDETKIETKRTRKPRNKATTTKEPKPKTKIKRTTTTAKNKVIPTDTEDLKDNAGKNCETTADDISHDEANGSSNEDTDGNQTEKSTKEKSAGKKTNKEIDEFIAQWKQHLDCVICSQTFPNLTLLRKHFRELHPNDRCYISCCQRKLRHRFHIEEHIRFHIDPNAFKCDVCDKCCTNSRTLNNHKLEKHTEVGQQRPFECTICQKRFAKKTVLKCHMETHKTGTDFECGECGKGFSTEQRRKVHERMVHNVDRVCDQCGKTIHGIYALKQHLLEHAGIQKPKWPCDQCNAQLYSHSSLKRHKQVAHHDGSTVYVCGDCGKIAATATALRSHKKYVHEAERKHKCTICDKAFKVAVVLREHMATHTGEDLYTCPHCPRTFKVSSNMHHHRKKAHPKEWAEGRLNRPIVPKVDVNQISHEVVM